MRLLKLNCNIFKIIFFIGLIISNNSTQAQFNKNLDTIKLTAIIYNGDTISCTTISNIYIQCKLTFAQREALAKYNRLRNAVYVTYPYARKSGIILNDLNKKLYGITDRRSRKKCINAREKELKKEFTTPLTNLSVYQGKILMKLINRETGNSCYEIIKEYQGGLAAGVYQTVAFFFNSSLKQAYSPKDEDIIIEKIVQEVQRMYGYPEIALNPSL
jgi:hypothetical protein